ncbi:FliM/FliN family flagellar motor switch protein, partial [Campylobacter lari]|nr:FliM/FliN family flagellar motor switch protein [Campylobacter lari]
LGKTFINVNEFLDLKQGDILKLDRSADDKAIVAIDKKEVFLAQVGLHRFRKSIKILELIKTDKDEIKEMLEKYEDERRAKANSYDDNEELEEEDDDQ